MRDVRVAVVPSEGADFEIRETTIADPGPHEVLVRIVATGLCHTDVAVKDGDLPAQYPEVLGHEGAGIVEAVGEHVTHVEPGDPVVLSYGSCGHCRTCRRGDPAYCAHFEAYNFGNERQGGEDDVLGDGLHAAFFQQSSFATFAIAHERNTVKVPDDVDLALLGPLGCGVQTGCGAVLRSLRPPAGSTLAVWGVGTVGLSAVMGAKIAGCARIVAIDVQPERLEMAKSLGATDVFDASDDDVVEQIQEALGRPLEFAVECSGRPDAASQAFESLGQMGVLAVVGAPPGGTEYSFDANDLILKGVRIVGVVEGEAEVRSFIPELIELHRQGRFPFDKLVTRFDFDDINEAVEKMGSGDVIKPVLVMPSAG